MNGLYLIARGCKVKIGDILVTMFWSMATWNNFNWRLKLGYSTRGNTSLAHSTSEGMFTSKWCIVSSAAFYNALQAHHKNYMHLLHFGWLNPSVPQKHEKETHWTCISVWMALVTIHCWEPVSTAKQYIWRRLSICQIKQGSQLMVNIKFIGSYWRSLENY